MRVALFIPCLVDTLFPATGRATVALLERLGCEVRFPLEQTCCGQMHANSGHERDGLALARRFARVFETEAADAIVAPSGSCVAMVREQYPRLAGHARDETLLAQVRTLAPRVHELSQFLVGELGLEDVGAVYPHRVTYHASCHGLRALGVGDAPLRLLRRVRGIDLVELEEAETCCGFGGTFAVKNAETSSAMLTAKLARVHASGADVCTAGDDSCLMHIGGGLRRQGATSRVVHLAEILATTGAGDAA